VTGQAITLKLHLAKTPAMRPDTSRRQTLGKTRTQSIIRKSPACCGQQGGYKRELHVNATDLHIQFILVKA
jgi:hypothetical protein